MLSTSQGGLEATPEEHPVEGLTPLGQQPHGDERARVDVSTPGKCPAMRVDIDERAGFILPQVRNDLVAEHPWMAEQEPSFVSFMDVERSCLLAHGPVATYA
jgi:hypothetical protein